MGDEITRGLGLQEQGSMLPFTVIQKSTRKAVGITTYMDISTDDRHMKIGSTWYRQSFQRTAVNTETKFLLLRKAFEDLDCIAVEFRTHFVNHKSGWGRSWTVFCTPTASCPMAPFAIRPSIPSPRPSGRR